jgi:hypothetical protein
MKKQIQNEDQLKNEFNSFISNHGIKIKFVCQESNGILGESWLCRWRHSKEGYYLNNIKAQAIQEFLNTYS